MKREISECLYANLERRLDEQLHRSHFVRRKNTLLYVRETEKAVQKIEIAIEIHPKDWPNSAAAVYPYLEVRMEAVNLIVTEMIGGNSTLVGTPNITLREPVGFTARSIDNARWPVFQPDSVPGVVDEMALFLQQWTLPFLDSYTNPVGICNAHDQNDKRAVLIHPLYVVAAMVLCGRRLDAMAIMEQRFGKPGLRKRYKVAFDYLTAKS